MDDTVEQRAAVVAKCWAAVRVRLEFMCRPGILFNKREINQPSFYAIILFEIGALFVFVFFIQSPYFLNRRKTHFSTFCFCAYLGKRHVPPVPKKKKIQIQNKTSESRKTTVQP